MNEQNCLHVVSLNVPYPPNYGGIIDIFFKIKALHDSGVKIILHTFQYEREQSEVLSAITKDVFYYKRKKGLRYLLSAKPFIVITRQSKELEKRLLRDNYPVLFEGLHTTHALDRCLGTGKRIFVRTHNIEHKYYQMLAGSERNLIRKLYLVLEARKLEKYEHILQKAHHLLSISSTDTAYFNEKYKNSIYVSAFHQHVEVSSKTGMGKYILFHGNLSVPENEKALLYLAENVLSKIDFQVIIAGKDPGRYLRNRCAKYSNIKLISNPEEEEMNRLVADAHINLLYTYQPTGLKLKLLHSLYGGRFCMANPLMLSGSGLDSLCVVYRSPGEAIEKIEELMTISFEKQMIEDRTKTLKEYSNSFNAEKIIKIL